MLNATPNTFRFMCVTDCERQKGLAAVLVSVIAQDRRRRRNVVTGYGSPIEVGNKADLHKMARSAGCHVIVRVKVKA